MDSLDKKLFDILEKKLRLLESDTFGTEQRRQARINEMWNECMSKADLKRIGKLVGLLTEKNNEEVWVKDPLNEGYIVINQEIALKIASLGYIP